MTQFLLFALVALAGAAGLYWRWRTNVDREIAEGAEVEWSRMQANEPAFLGGLTRAEFDAAYRRAHFPRFPKYALACAATFVVVSPLALALLDALLWAAEAAGLVAEPAELAKYVPVGRAGTPAGAANREEIALYLAADYAGFYYFFGLVGAWIATVAAFMSQFHRRRPGFLREEIIRAREAKENCDAVSAHHGAGERP